MQIPHVQHIGNIIHHTSMIHMHDLKTKFDNFLISFNSIE
jgi:hypothetical protein